MDCQSRLELLRKKSQNELSNFRHIIRFSNIFYCKNIAELFNLQLLIYSNISHFILLDCYSEAKEYMKNNVFTLLFRIEVLEGSRIQPHTLFILFYLCVVYASVYNVALKSSESSFLIILNFIVCL